MVRRPHWADGAAVSGTVRMAISRYRLLGSGRGRNWQGGFRTVGSYSWNLTSSERVVIDMVRGNPSRQASTMSS